MEMYLTKYALTKGIEKVEAELALGLSQECWKVDNYYGLYKPNECHEYKEDAILAAEEMRIKKIKSLSRQIKKLEKITFRI